jgi:hypothetical protein
VPLKIGRIVVRGWPHVDLEVVRNKLLGALKSCAPCDFLALPGGFIIGPFPEKWEGRCGWESRDKDFEDLVPHAEKTLWRVLTQQVLTQAQKVCRFLTVPVDLRGACIEHVELIALVDVLAGETVGWTGKSYPTMDQENSLIHVRNPKSHQFNVGAERVLILGCHDLNIFNGRARANQKPGGHRHQRCQEMLEAFDAFHPTCIIQHPHGTDTWKSWNASWRAVERRYPSVAWASAIAYASNGAYRAPLKDVLARTHCEGEKAENVIIRGNPFAAKIQRHSLPLIS